MNITEQVKQTRKVIKVKHSLKHSLELLYTSLVT